MKTKQERTFKRDFEMRYGVSPDNGNPTANASQNREVCEEHITFRHEGCDACDAEWQTHAQGKPDGTVAVATLPKHSPLPWSTTEQGLFVRNESARICTMTTADPRTDESHDQRALNAKLIVASVNNADKLAEALRDCLPTISAASETGIAAYNKARQALADWEKAKQ